MGKEEIKIGMSSCKKLIEMRIGDWGFWIVLLARKKYGLAHYTLCRLAARMCCQAIGETVVPIVFFN